MNLYCCLLNQCNFVNKRHCVKSHEFPINQGLYILPLGLIKNVFNVENGKFCKKFSVATFDYGPVSRVPDKVLIAICLKKLMPR